MLSVCAYWCLPILENRFKLTVIPSFLVCAGRIFLDHGSSQAILNQTFEACVCVWKPVVAPLYLTKVGAGPKSGQSGRHQGLVWGRHWRATLSARRTMSVTLLRILLSLLTISSNFARCLLALFALVILIDCHHTRTFSPPSSMLEQTGGGWSAPPKVVHTFENPKLRRNLESGLSPNLFFLKSVSIKCYEFLKKNSHVNHFLSDISSNRFSRQASNYYCRFSPQHTLCSSSVSFPLGICQKKRDFPNRIWENSHIFFYSVPYV